MISETLEAIATNIENAYDELETKGATLPANKNIENLADTIASIQTGGGGVEKVYWRKKNTLAETYTTLELFDYEGQTENILVMGTLDSGNSQSVYLNKL